jgi:hypothetical protein
MSALPATTRGGHGCRAQPGLVCSEELRCTDTM